MLVIDRCQNISNSPLVSVIIPAYNAEAFIERTLSSVLAQTYPNIEVLVVNDGSTDGTVEIVQRMAEQDARIFLLHQENAGVAAARNLAIQQAKGEFIAPIDADDIWYPENIEKQIQCFLSSGSNVGLVYSWSICIDADDALTGGFCAFWLEGDVLLTLLCHNFLGNASASMMRRSCLEEVGYYNTELRAQNAQGCEDWDLYLRLAGRYQFRVVPQFLVGYRKLQSSMSRNYTSMVNSWCFTLEATRQRHPKVPDFLCRLSVSYFLLYLAYECDRVGDAENTLLLLRSAWQMNWVMLLIRPNLYRLAISSWWQLRTKHTQSSTPTQPKKTVVSQLSWQQPTLSISKQQWIKIWLMVLLGNVFYWVVPKLARLQTQLFATQVDNRSFQAFLANQK